MSTLCTINVNAQGQATVTILEAIGGTTDPTNGTYTYADGTTITLTATPSTPEYIFNSWIISAGESTTTDLNEITTLTVSGGTTYTIQPVFLPVQVPPGVPVQPSEPTTDAYVMLVAAVGGTTNPPPGLYRLADATQFYITAVPSDGWQFSQWVISGFPYDTEHGGDPFTGVRTENPYLIDHGYGNRYDYQPVFTLIGGATPSPTAPGGGGVIGGLSTETLLIIALVVVIIIILIGFAVYAARRRR